MVQTIQATILVLLKCWDAFLHASGFIAAIGLNVFVGFKLYGGKLLKCCGRFLNYVFEMLVCIITMLVLAYLYQLHIDHNAHIVPNVFVFGFVLLHFMLCVFCYGCVFSFR